jgi:formyl-CoA transferase
MAPAAGDGTAAAVHAALRAVAAIVRRDRTGEGALLDAAGADAVIAQGWIGAVYGWNESRITDRSGLRPAGAPAFSSAKYQYYATSDDRFVLFCALEAKFWQRLCAVIDRPDLAATAGDDTQPVDFAHGDDELRHALQRIFERATARVARAGDHQRPADRARASRRHRLLDDDLRPGRSSSRTSIRSWTFHVRGITGTVDGELFVVRRPPWSASTPTQVGRDRVGQAYCTPGSAESSNRPPVIASCA